MPGILEFRQLTKKYPGVSTAAVQDFTLTVEQGELIVLIGPSGCGKTTTLRMVNRLVEPTSGTILLEAKDYKTYNAVELRRRLGYVIQRIGLLPHLTIAENISFVLRLTGVDRARRRARATELLEMVGLDPALYLDRFPRELSGGQQQRIGVLRALAHNPDIILMDEPFGALDPLMREQLQEEFKRLQQNVAKTIIFVTHDMDEALSMADRIVLMRDGQILQVATPEEMLRNPADDFVASFIGRQRMLRQASEVTVGEIMVAHPVTIGPRQGLVQGLELMQRRRVDTLIVKEASGRFLGIVSQADVQRHLKDGDTFPIGQAANREVPTIQVSDTALTAMHQMLEGHNVENLPVLDAEDKVAGLITRGSLVGLLGDALKAAQGAEEALEVSNGAGSDAPDPVHAATSEVN